jgi:hypothetical protein
MKTQIPQTCAPHNSHRSHRSHRSHSPHPAPSPLSSLPSPARCSPLFALSPLLLTLLALLTLPVACTVPKPLRGGRATTAPVQAGGLAQTLAQGENPSQPSKQSQESIKTRTYTIPAGTRFSSATLSPTLSSTLSAASEAPSAQRSRSAAPPLQPSAFSIQPLLLAAPMPVTEREELRARSELGAAQKDTARDLAAKLSSLKGIVWVGVALFVFGLASLVWPPLKLIIGSVTTSAAIMAGGLALMILPTLIVGNELLILGAVAVVVGCWFLAHRHGHLHGLVSSQSPPPSPSSQPLSQPLSPPINPPIQ